MWYPAPKDAALGKIIDINVEIKKHIGLRIKYQILVFRFWDSTQTVKCKFLFINLEIEN